MCHAQHAQGVRREPVAHAEQPEQQLLDAKRGLPKGLSRSVVRAFEALLLSPATLAYAGWFEPILGNPATAPCAAALVWRFEDGQTALPLRTDDRWFFIDARGEPCEPARGGVRPRR